MFSSKLGGDEHSNLLSRLTFSWLNGLIWKSFRITLEASDLYPLNRKQTSAVVAPEFRATAAATLSLVWRVFHFFKNDFLIQGAWAVVTSFAVFGPPILMKLMLQYLQSEDGMTRLQAWFCVCGFLISGLLAALADCQCNWIGRKMAAKLRTVLISEIYCKVLRKRIEKTPEAAVEVESNKKASTENQAGDGNTINLISVDTEVVSGIIGSLHLVWVIFPVQTFLGTYLLYRILGASGLLGVLFMIILLPLNMLLSKRMATVQGQVLTASDARLQASNELLQNIRTIKYCAWEVPFKEQILVKRALEMKQIRRRFIWWSITMTVFYSTPFLMTGMTCFLYTVVWGNNLRTSIAFPTLAIFAILRIPLDRLADTVTFVIQAHVSLVRIGKFLEERETQNYTQNSGSHSSVAGFDNATLTWPTGQANSYSDEEAIPLAEILPTHSFRLHGLQIQFKQYALNVVCGLSGSGKSSLLLALLGEMDLIRGQVFLPREETGDLAIAYCPQEAWIMNQSIKANILLGLPFDGSRYQAVLHAVTLQQDLATLEQGDETLAGENGSRLSGGQKQRVALARALYSLSKYVLLDDCLSALDTHTANHIFFHAIKGPLMRGRTCIFATHNTQLAMPHCDHIIMLDAGKIKAQGTGEELVSAGFIGADVMEGKLEIPATIFSSDEKSVKVTRIESNFNHYSSGSSLSESEMQDIDFDVEKSVDKLDYEEKKSEGAVPWSVIKTYLVAMGPGWHWAIILVGFGAQQVASLGTNLWIKEWAFQYDRAEIHGQSHSNSHIKDANKPVEVPAWYYLIIYTVVCTLYALITFMRDLTVFYGSLKASSNMYERLLKSILHAKLLFFDRVPLGQIINRFSRDIEVLDQSIAGFSISALQLVASLAMVIVFISIVLPVFLFVAVIILLAYCIVTAVYISGARDLKRIEAVERSPVYQQFGESLAGCVSIRAYACTKIFTAKNYKLLDRLNQPSLLLWASSEWLSLRVGALSSFISFSTGALILWNLKTINPGAAGLIFTYTASFTENVLWLVQVYAIIQQDLNSIDRIIEYTEIEQEPIEPLKKITTESIPYNWPSQGIVRFQDYTTAYAPELEASLKGISFEAKGGERVAIVGRTGAGKSTLTLALIRGLEASGGHIEIDGIDISSVTLTQLRQAITVVPQDPKLFEGSLRDNLAPLHSSNDEEMLEALRAVHLLGTADSNSDSVKYSDLDRAADTLSLGQRQLLCIARGLLRRSPVLVLDEATASVDHQTDIAIQAGLRASSMTGTTILTIAHRLATIADYDRVIVLATGRIVEQGSVRELLGRRGKDGIFRQMCEDSGDIDEIKRKLR